MLLQVLSDLHLETFPTYSHYKHHLTDASYLALLGDIGHVKDPDFARLLEKLLDHYSIVFYLLGNHDHNGLSMSEAKSRMRALEARLAKVSDERTVGKFVFLDQTRYDIDSKTTVLGCTLYSYVPSERAKLVEGSMIEFTQTKGWTLSQHLEAHRADVAWLNEQVEAIERDEPQRNVIVMSHHCPTFDGRASSLDHIGSPMQSAFCSHLSKELCWRSGSVMMWAWGHTHYNCEFEVEREGSRALRCFANQRGYYKSPKDTYDETAVVDVSDGRVTREKRAKDQVRKNDDQEKKGETANGQQKSMWRRLKNKIAR